MEEPGQRHEQQEEANGSHSGQYARPKQAVAIVSRHLSCAWDPLSSEELRGRSRLDNPFVAQVLPCSRYCSFHFLLGGGTETKRIASMNRTIFDDLPGDVVYEIIRHF